MHNIRKIIRPKFGSISKPSRNIQKTKSNTGSTTALISQCSSWRKGFSPSGSGRAFFVLLNWTVLRLLNLLRRIIHRYFTFFHISQTLLKSLASIAGFVFIISYAALGSAAMKKKPSLLLPTCLGAAFETHLSGPPWGFPGRGTQRPAPRWRWHLLQHLGGEEEEEESTWGR